jgi:hypothetical protein
MKKKRMSQANITKFFNQLQQGDTFKILLPYGISVDLLFLSKEEYKNRLRRVFAVCATESANHDFTLDRGGRLSGKLDDWFVRTALIDESLQRDMVVISAEKEGDEK